jgi:hypothetical protein
MGPSVRPSLGFKRLDRFFAGPSKGVFTQSSHTMEHRDRRFVEADPPTQRDHH